MPAEILTGALASAFYFGLAPRINQPLYRQLLFFPARFPPDFTGIPVLEGVPGEDVFFKGSMNQNLNGWFFQKPNNNHVILFNHGNSGNLTIRHHLSRLMLLAGYSVFVYDYQGFGRSSGIPSIHGICSDGEAAFDYLVNERGYAPEQIVVYGESLGASVATHLSFSRPAAGIVLQSGFASLKRIANEHFPFLRLYPSALFPKPALDNVAILKNSTLPLLLIHGDLDRVIPVKHSVDMYEAHPGRKRLVRLANTAHGDIWSTAADEYVQALIEFTENLTGTSSTRNIDKIRCESFIPD